MRAMASGTACIATRVPGNKDVITDSVNGLLVEPRDSASIFAALSRILGDGTLRNRLENRSLQFCTKIQFH